jgi:hypothetical protein
VNGRDTFQALQAHLAAAHAAAERGDRAAALARVDAALAIDPQFLAAQALRARLLADEPSPSSAPRVAQALPPTEVAGAPIVVPRDVSPESYAKFQERARRRRLDTRIAAARQALRRRRLDDAASALNELSQLDPTLPELTALTREFGALRRRASASSHRGPWIAAGAAFAATVLGATYLQDSSTLTSRPLVGSGVTLSAAPGAAPVVDVAAVGTAGAGETIEGLAPPPEKVTESRRSSALQTPPADVRPPTPAPQAVAARGAPASAPSVARVQPTRPPMLPPPASQSLRAAPPAMNPAPPPAANAAPPPAANVAPPPPAVAAPEPAAAPSTTAVVTSPTPSVVASPTTVVAAPTPTVVRGAPNVDESVLVSRTLQRYRAAYQDLDARSAQAVWPAVNQAALARAFNGLESQTLTFDDCDVRVSGEAAWATCRGSARYVPKVGSRDPRTESRTWTFTLKKAGEDWKIDTARADR